MNDLASFIHPLFQIYDLFSSVEQKDDILKMFLWKSLGSDGVVLVPIKGIVGFCMKNIYI